MIKTAAGEKMKKENPVNKKTDIDQDGQYEAWEQARQEAIDMALKFEPEEKLEMHMGGIMGEGMGVIIGIEAESGNEIPAGSLPEEVADDIPAMLSEGEYVVPADVVRWHGVKMLEGLRSEAKMGMGLMAEDGRLSEVEDYDDHGNVKYDIEEDDKPKMERPEIKVVEAAEGVLTTQPFYQLRYVTDPVTGTVKMAYVDPTTGQEVSLSQFEKGRASRFDVKNVLQREGLMTEEAVEEAVEEAAEEETVCPPGFVRSAATGNCVPVSIQQRDDPESDSSFFDQTRGVAEALGATYEDDPDAALTRALQENRALDITPGGLAGSVLTGLPLLGVAVNEVVRFADTVGAQRALLGREQYLGITKNIRGAAMEDEGFEYTGPQTYNFTLRSDGTFEESTGGAGISRISESTGGKNWVSDYNHIDLNGNKIDPFRSDKDFNTFLEAVDPDDGDDSDDSDDSDDGDKTTSAEDNTSLSNVLSSEISREEEDEKQGRTQYLDKGGSITRKNTPRTVAIKY